MAQVIQQPQKVARPLFESEKVLAVFVAIGTVLAVRFFLLLAVMGAFVLAYMAIPALDSHSLWVLGIYGVLTILPLVWLDIRTRGRA